MKVTFPHMGNMYITGKVLLDTIGIDYVIPPNCNKKTLEYGVMHSPEFICLPFKTMLGDFMHGINSGADVIIFGGGCGQCRQGYYGDLYAEILKDTGNNVQIINLELGKINIKDIIKKLRPLTKGKSAVSIIKGVIYAVITALAVDRLYTLANYKRCREYTKGETDIIMNQFENRVKNVKGFKSIKELIALTKKSLKGIKIDKEFDPLKIAIVGEIYVATEPYINLNIEKTLGNMGVEVYNSLGVGEWIKEHMIKRILPFRSANKPHEVGKEFMKTNDIGGHGLETIGNSILSARKRFDGVIHLYPFTCMPEIIAYSTFNELQNKYKIPIMTLILDEMTGETGYMTRIEAFVDMLKRKKEIQKSDYFNLMSIE